MDRVGLCPRDGGQDDGQGAAGGHSWLGGSLWGLPLAGIRVTQKKASKRRCLPVTPRVLTPQVGRPENLHFCQAPRCCCCCCCFRGRTLTASDFNQQC